MPYTYVGCAQPATGPHKRAAEWERWCRAIDPGGRSGGVYNRRKIAGSNDWSVHACGRALDWFPASREAGDMILARAIVDWPVSDLQFVLWRQFQWGGAAGPILQRTGRQDHNDHLHIEWRP